MQFKLVSYKAYLFLVQRMFSSSGLWVMKIMYLARTSLKLNYWAGLNLPSSMSRQRERQVRILKRIFLRKNRLFSKFSIMFSLISSKTLAMAQLLVHIRDGLLYEAFRQSGSLTKFWMDAVPGIIYIWVHQSKTGNMRGIEPAIAAGCVIHWATLRSFMK